MECMLFFSKEDAGKVMTLKDLYGYLTKAGLAFVRSADQWPDRFGRYHLVFTTDIIELWNPVLAVELSGDIVQRAIFSADDLEERDNASVCECVKGAFEQVPVGAGAVCRKPDG